MPYIFLTEISSTLVKRAKRKRYVLIIYFILVWPLTAFQALDSAFIVVSENSNEKSGRSYIGYTG